MNYLYAIVIGLLVTASFAAGWREKAIRVSALLEAQKVADIAQCEADKAITKEANDALQKNLDTVNSKLAISKRLHLSHCITPIRTNMAESGQQFSGRNGISSDWLRDYAARAETARSTALTCEEFIKNERK